MKFIQKHLTLALILGISTASVFASNEDKSIANTEIKEVNISLNNIRGTVVDEFGEPIVGAFVKTTQTHQMTITDVEGKYTIKATPSESIAVSIVGSKDYESKITSSNIVNFNIKN